MIEIYPSDFAQNIRYGLTHAISISEEIHYNEVGKMTLVADASAYNITALKVGNIVYDTDMRTTFVIVKVKIQTSTNRITANGYTADFLLNRRVIADENQIVNIESGVYTVINNNLRGLPKVKTAPVKGLTEVYQGDDETTEDVDESILHGGQLLDEITPVLEYGELGRRMVWDGKNLEWTFEIFKGVDRTSGIHAMTFSAEQGTAQDLIINDDDSEMYTMAFVRWQWEGVAQQHIVGVTGSGDPNARELWVESSVNVSVEKDEDYATTKKKAIADAMDALEEQIRKQSFTVTISPEEYGTVYGMGDIVSCVSLRHGMSFKARVTGVKYTMDANQRKFEVVLGEPEMTILEVIRNGKY